MALKSVQVEGSATLPRQTQTKANVKYKKKIPHSMVEDYIQRTYNYTKVNN